MACVQFNEKKGQESPVKGHNYQFLPIRFSRFKAFPVLQSSLLKVLTEN